MEYKEMYDTIVEALADKKAREMVSIDIHKITTIADSFIICSGTSTTHIKTLADNVDQKMKEKGMQLLRKEGYNSARWILLDYGEIIVHVFHEEDREFYNLERLWQDGEKRVINNLN